MVHLADRHHCLTKGGEQDMKLRFYSHAPLEI